jgi:hydroxymethylglutaryl-CoA reductase
VVVCKKEEDMSLRTVGTKERWDLLNKHNSNAHKAQAILYGKDAQEADDTKLFQKNIENFIGTVTV